MELSKLAAKQKRAKDWSDFVTNGGVQDSELESEIVKTLGDFKRKITQCWEAKAVSPEDEQAIKDLERRLEQLNEEARMRVVGKRPSGPVRVI